MIIYFEPTVLDDEVALALRSIESLDGVVEAGAVTQDETYAQFLELFGDNRKLVEAVTADILPPSITVRVDSPSSLDAVETYASSLSGLREVIRAGEVLSPAVENMMGPDQLERWCNGDS